MKFHRWLVVLVVSLIGCLIAQTTCELATGDDGKPIAIQKLSSSDGKLYSMPVQIDLEPSITATMMVDSSRRRHWLAKRELAHNRTSWSRLVVARNEFYKHKLGNGLTIKGDIVRTNVGVSGLSHENEIVLIASQITSGDNTEHWQQLDFDGAFALSSHPYRFIDGRESVDVATGVDRLVHSLYLNQTATDPNSAGALIFGGTDRRFYKGEIKWIPYFDNIFESYGRTNVTAISLNWGDSANHNETHNYREREWDSAVFDSTSPFIVGNGKVIDEFMASYLGTSKLMGSYYMLSCDLDDKPNIVFKLGTLEDPIELVLEPKDYVLKINFSDTPTDCISALRARRSSEDRGSYDRRFKVAWSFGTTVMKKYYMVFDHKLKQLGIASPN